MSSLTSLSGAARSTRDRLLRAVLRRAAKPIDSGQVDGGRGSHPLGAANLQTPDQAPPDAPGLAPLGTQALLAGKGDPRGLADTLSWIAQDRPGQGDDWTDPGQVACRLIHLAAIWVWTRPDAAPSAAIGGSAQDHARWLLRERPLDDADPNLTLTHAACVIAGLSWPALEDASNWVGECLASLRSSTRALVGPDGAPTAEPAVAARALWAVALARSWADSKGCAVPADLTGALLQGSTCLWRLCGDTGSLPAAGPAPLALLPLSPVALPLTLRGLVLAWGLDQGKPVCLEDPAVLRLAGHQCSGDPSPMAPDGQWRLWSWRSTGMAVAHAQVKGHSGRGWFRQSSGRAQWDLDGEPLVIGQRAPLSLTVARVDGPKARVIAVVPGVDAQADHRAERELLWRQARFVVTDRGVQRIDWELGPGWALSPDDKGDWSATQGARSLHVKLDGQGWTWTVDDRRIVGHGDPAVAVRSIFELR